MNQNDFPEEGEREVTIVEKPITTLQMWMGFALLVSKKSIAPDRKVGAVAVSSSGILLGWGFNQCVDDDDPSTCDDNGRTKDETIHAEEDLIQRAADNGKSLRDSTVFINVSPCLRCAARLKHAGVKRIYFLEDFKKGISHDFILRHGIDLVQVMGVDPEVDKSIREEEDFQDHINSLLQGLETGGQEGLLED
jgi:dCMP deaminase